jgi:hypothetical protein
MFNQARAPFRTNGPNSRQPQRPPQRTEQENKRLRQELEKEANSPSLVDKFIGLFSSSTKKEEKASTPQPTSTQEKAVAPKQSELEHPQADHDQALQADEYTPTIQP